MLQNLNLSRVLFIDIETVSAQKSYQELNPDWKNLWDKKANFIAAEEEAPEDVYAKSSIYAEFGKIICISVGVYRDFGKTKQFRVKSFFGDDEKKILQDFCALLKEKFESPDILLCAHNGKEFDFPYLARRILVNRMPIPPILNSAGRKPWEIQHLDTLNLWKFGDYKHYTSLDLLCQLFGIKSPKSDMSGADVGKVYWEEGNLKKIVEYCQEDVIAIAQLLLAFIGKSALKNKEITII